MKKIIYALFALSFIVSCSSKKTESKPVRELTFNDTLHTDYFDYIVLGTEFNESVNTGNEFTDLKPAAGSKYLVFSVTLKNVDTESRIPLPGSVWINYNGKNYEFDKPETVMAPHWGMGFEPVNPLETRSLNMVYKLSSEMKGVLFWQPGRANSDQKINIGTLK